MKALTNEFLQIFKEKKLLVAISAILVIPVLYAGMFLWAFWDPYDHLPDLPIAVVNEDAGVDNDGEFLHLGDELVDNLKDEPEFDFHFVDKEKGYEGLKNEDYYILIEIPEVFSKNSITVMDDSPKKAPLIYVPNESFNFLSSQIGETAMLQIEVALQEKITETYAETIFDTIEEVADGLTDASDATVELDDGAKELKDGSEEISDNLHTLASKSLEFTDGVNEVVDGTKELNDGSTALADGLHQLTDASGQLLDASGQLKTGTNTLADGIKSANDGMKEMNTNIPALIEGTNEVKSGLSTFKKELPKQMGNQIAGKLDESVGAMQAGLDELQAGITKGLEEDLANGLINGVSSGLAEEIITTQTAQTKELAKVFVENGVDPELVANIMQGVQAESPSEEALAAQLKEQLTPKINGAISATNKSVATGFNSYTKAVGDNLADATGGVEKAIAESVNPIFNQLIDGIGEINKGQQALQSGVNQLADGTKQLQEGSSTLVNGQSEYVDNIATFNDKIKEANTGAHTLADGTVTLVDGMGTLFDASIALHDGSDKLAEGSDELVDGMDELVDGTEEFKEEMKTAADEANDITTTSKNYEMFADPVDVSNEKINTVPNYGTGFAPYFLSLGLFVGALLLSIVFPLREPAIAPKNAFQWFYSKFAVIFVVGVIQALIASALLIIGLGLEVQSLPLFLLFAILTSLVFVTLIQFLVTCLDDPGRFIAILILIMQLTTSAGTFPLELIPKALQPLNYLLPMTYSVSGFKAVISSGDYSVMWQNAGILIGFTIVFMLLTYSYFAVMFKRKYGKNVEAY